MISKILRSLLLVPGITYKGSRFKSNSAHVKMQVFTQKRNPITGGTEWDVQHEDYDYHQEISRSAFADMLHDTERNKKYYRALQLAIEKMHDSGKKANVLDIGTGTGLLSIMAAKCGADTITACEAFKPMAECCIKILQQNGVADKIKVIPKKSTDLTVGDEGDMKEKANILVTEVFDTELIGEGALPTFSHAHKFLLEEDCIVVPDSAVVYAQVVECPTLQKWNKLYDLADEDLEVLLRTPQKINKCAGSPAVHDIQLSQLPRKAFKELSDIIPVFYYDWSGKSPIDMKRMVKQQFTVTNTGKAQMVFVWWELNMDTEGKICLSCAPWWGHPDANLSSETPQDTIPWRDHWMQGVYYLPQECTIENKSDVSLVSCQDEYSMWFYLENENLKQKHSKRPICECGLHMALSRTHISYLNDGRRSKKFLAQIRKDLVQNAVVLDLNGSSLLGLAAAKMGAKIVYILEDLSLNIGILNDYMKENGIENVQIIPQLTDEVFETVTNIVCDPNFSSVIYPWENLKMAYLLYEYRNKLTDVIIMPDSCEFWAMPVEFQDLHKICAPLHICEGIDMSIFDNLVQGSRKVSDNDIEVQPLWEYQSKCRGVPRKLFEINMKNLKRVIKCNGENTFVDVDMEETSSVNGFAIWAVWVVGGKQISSGPVEWPVLGEKVHWDMHTRQAVQILESSITVSGSDKWNFKMAYDLEGDFNFSINWIQE